MNSIFSIKKYVKYTVRRPAPLLGAAFEIRLLLLPLWKFQGQINCMHGEIKPTLLRAKTSLMYYFSHPDV